MKNNQITHEEFRGILPLICDKKTVYQDEKDNWMPDNPLYAHCDIISVLAHKYFGGRIVVADFMHPQLQRIIGHYSNILPDKKPVDFTIDQFKGEIPEFLKPKDITNSVEHLSIKKSKRFKLLLRRFTKKLRQTRKIKK